MFRSKASPGVPIAPADQLAEFKAPVHLAHGDVPAGFVPEAELKEFARIVPQATFTRFPGAGHALHSQRAEEFAADLGQFLVGFA